MIFGWKKEKTRLEEQAVRSTFTHSPNGSGLIRFQEVSLPPSISRLSLDIPLGSWVVLGGKDDFAKALFCDLCFHYIHPEQGKVDPLLSGRDVSFLGRASTTYGRSLVDHLTCGVQESSRNLLEIVGRHSLSERFHRHLEKESLEFKGGKISRELELDERDHLELAEANLLLQRRRAAVIDTTTDFYQIAKEQGFQHSDLFLGSGKTILWIVDESKTFSGPWSEKQNAGITKKYLSFPTEARSSYIN